jgi:glycine cleavage system regulatory protein
MKNLIISFICPDRSGLVSTLSSLIKQHQGNWQTSSLHHLSGYFAGIIEVSVANEDTEKLITDINSIDGMQTQVAITSPKLTNENEQATIELELTANDRTGIIQDISSVIHHQGGNLLKLVSVQDNAPHSGQLIFKAKAKIAVVEQNIAPLIEQLENLADDLIVDINR